MEITDERAAQVPLIEQLRSVPKNARHIYEESPTHSRSIPFGRLCHEAADALEQDTYERRVKALAPEIGMARAVSRAALEALPVPAGDVAEPVASDRQVLIGLLTEARDYVEDPRLQFDDLSRRRRKETRQQHEDRVSNGIQANEDRQELLDRIAAILVAAPALPYPAATPPDREALKDAATVILAHIDEGVTPDSVAVEKLRAALEKANG